MDNPWRLDPVLLSGGRAAARIDTGTAHPARMYDYYLGGRDNYEVDRFQAESILTDFPQLRSIAQANRAFLQRAVRHLAEAGITQFLDIGTGIPSPGNASETARAINPDARMVFVDNDPIVLTHAQARLGGPDPRDTAVIEADLRTPKAILADPALLAVLDLAQPVGLLLVSVLHFLPDRDRPHLIVKGLMDALAPGSCLVLSHATADRQQDKALSAAEQYRHTSAPITLRSPEQIVGFFNGLDLLEPGVVKQPWWRPDREVVDDPELNWGYGGVGVKRGEASEPCAPTTNVRNPMDDDGKSTEDDLIYDEKQPGRQLAAALDALATHPLAPAPGGISYLRIPADPPLHTLRARMERAAMSQRVPEARGSKAPMPEE